VDTHFPLRLSCAHVDANQLELALLNLAVNARDAMPEGGRFSISGSERVLLPGGESGLNPGMYVCLSVTDTGIGMDATTLARAAEPFFTTKEVGKGTGLGLAMVHGLAAQSGGRLILRSEPGQGTTAELWIPAAQEKPQAKWKQGAAEAAPTLLHVAPLTILVVDDDALVLANTAAMLEDLGHTVLQAPSGHDALALLRAGHRVDLVMTDHAMPGMTGAQLASTLRSERPELPILLVSGYADMPADTPDQVGKLNKPFDQAALAQAVSDTVGLSNGAAIIPLRERRDQAFLMRE
jgi:CheY-like chemotaxis protein